MTNVANQNRNKTKENEFETIQLPAPDILRIRFENESQSQNFLLRHISATTCFANLGLEQLKTSKLYTKLKTFAIRFINQMTVFITLNLELNQNQRKLNIAHQAVLITTTISCSFSMVKLVAHEKDSSLVTILIWLTNYIHPL